MVDLASLRIKIESELEGNLLPFWRQRCVDFDRGGFIAEMANDGTVREDAPRGLILNSRLLWTFAALYRHLGDERDLELARRAFEVLESKFRDRQHGGYFWRVDDAGRALDQSKKIYGQAFCIYAFSEYFLATDDAEALAAARELFQLIETHAHDSTFSGYIEARAADWSAATDLRLSDKDMDAAKSMNNHLHLLEAYTNLYRAWPDDRVATQLDELITIFGRHIISRDADDRHLHHFFDESWNLASDTSTYGHDIETAWLLCEATEVLGDEELEATVRLWAIDLARTTLAQAIDDDGGIAYEGRGAEVINPDRDWWCQAEAVVGFWHAYGLTGDPAFADAAMTVWQFIDRHQIDRVHGEWFWRVRADGTIDETEPKVSEWKGPYHTVRMCLEMMRRLDEGVVGEKP
jgi:mannobiose 2-epimerase